MNLQELQITRTTEEYTERYVYAITKTNNTSYSPTTIINTKIPATTTQMAYKKTNTKTQIDTKKRHKHRHRHRHRHRDKERKNTDKDIVDKSDRRIYKIVNIYIN